MSYAFSVGELIRPLSSPSVPDKLSSDICSIASIIKRSGSVHDNLFAISYILGFTIAHCHSCGILTCLILSPDSNKKSLLSFGNTSASASHSSKDTEAESIKKELEEEKDFVVVCGYGRIGKVGALRWHVCLLF